MKVTQCRYWLYSGLIMALIVIGGGWPEFNVLSKESKPFGYHVLRINGKYISPEVFREERNRFFKRWCRNAVMLRKTDEERNDLLLEAIIDRVVSEDYLYHQAKVTVTPREIDDYIDRYIKPKYGTAAAMNAYMTESGNNSPAKLRKTVDLYLRKLKYFTKIAKELKISVPPAELEARYQQHVEENRKAIVRHILIAVPDSTAAATKAWEVYRQLKNGADFGKLAAQYSADETTKFQGGWLESFSKAETLPEIAGQVFNAKPNTLIPPFQTKMGYEIILVDRFIEFFHPQAEFADMMLLEKFGALDQYQKWLDGIKRKQKIEILDPAMKAYRFYRDGRFNQAGSWYEKAYAVSGFENHLIRAIESYQEAENWVKLIKLGQMGMNKFPAKVPYYLNKAEGLYRTGKSRAALDLMKKAEELAENNIYYISLIGQMYAKLNLQDEAARVRQKRVEP